MTDHEAAKVMREAGWSVAVHNDYRFNGQPMTFWLWTHPSGRWVKGEGATDAEALAAAIRNLPIPYPSTAPATGDDEIVEAMANAICGPADCFLSDLTQRARDKALDDAAEKAREQRDDAKRARQRPGLRHTMRFASDEAKAEIFAEDRGEKIASEMIEKAILPLKGTPHASNG